MKAIPWLIPLNRVPSQVNKETLRRVFILVLPFLLSASFHRWSMMRPFVSNTLEKLENLHLSFRNSKLCCLQTRQQQSAVQFSKLCYLQTRQQQSAVSSSVQQVALPPDPSAAVSSQQSAVQFSRCTSRFIVTSAFQRIWIYRLRRLWSLPPWLMAENIVQNEKEITCSKKLSWGRNVRN